MPRQKFADRRADIGELRRTVGRQPRANHFHQLDQRGVWNSAPRPRSHPQPDYRGSVPQPRRRRRAIVARIPMALGNTCVFGDWIRLGDGTDGRVTKTNWRSTNLLTGENNIVALPNSILARQSVTNLSRPDETHLIALSARIATTQRPLCRGCSAGRVGSQHMHIRNPPPTVSLRPSTLSPLMAVLVFRVDSLSIGTATRSSICSIASVE